jgi:hypothetical protein
MIKCKFNKIAQVWECIDTTYYLYTVLAQFSERKDALKYAKTINDRNFNGYGY